MAERRMFAKTIIDSDAFLDMPLSTQALYFHLSMRADDDGFVNNHKNIRRMIGCSEDDIKLLAMKKFIIPFESGVVVIKHWKIHNYIQKDRYKETKYKDEKSMLLLDKNDSYSLEEGVPIEEARNTYKSAKALTDARKKRLEAKKESSLPYSFEYKIRNAFIGQKCPICNCTMSNENRLVKPTIQHNIPISKGGKHEIDNISVICAGCNTSIQNRAVTEPYNTELVKEIWERIGNVSGMDTQVRLELGKDNKEKNIKKEIDKVEVKTSTHSQKFIPPSLEEVREYCNERNNSVDPNSFIDFYESKGWFIGKNKMKNWKAAVRTWERKEQGTTVKKQSTFTAHI